MANRAVNLLRRDGDKRFHDVSFTNNGRIKNEGAGIFYLDWREGAQRKRKSVGDDPNEALTQLKRKEAELNAVAEGVAVIPTSDGNTGHSLASAIATYLGEIKLTKKPKTFTAYSTALNYFTESCSRPTVESITREDMLRFSAFLRDSKGLSPRSCSNKFLNVASFLKAQGVRGLLRKNDCPSVTEETPEIYEADELAALFAACDDRERLWYEFFLASGMREQEVMHCEWSDVNVKKGTVTVRWKPQWGFMPKKYKERHIPIPDEPNSRGFNLMAVLKAHRAKATKGCNLLFPTSGCRPKNDFLNCLKAVAKRAGLDKKDFWLHKFRATFATTHLRNGTDLSTVQNWMGHSGRTGIQSTMRYLRPSEGDAVRAKVNSAF